MRSNVFVPRFIAFRCLKSHASIAHLNPANLSASTKSTEPAYGARGVFHCISAGQDPSARRCAYLDRPAVTSGGSRHTMYRDTHTEARMTTTEPPTRRPTRPHDPTPAQALREAITP